MNTGFFEREYVYKFLRSQPDTFLMDHVEDFITYLRDFQLYFRYESQIIEEFYKFIKIRKKIDPPEYINQFE